MTGRSWRRLWWMAGLSLVLAAGSANAGPPFETDDPEPVEPGHWEVYGFTLGSFVHGESAGLLPATELNYGALENLQLHLVAGAAFNSQSVTGTEFGFADVTLGAKFRFITATEDDWWPQVGTFPMLSLRSGDVTRGLGTGRIHEFLPL